MLWDEDDTFGRWVQFFCAVPLIALGGASEYYWWTSPFAGQGWFGAGGAGLLFVGLRCLWYAITGNNNINRDDF